MKQPVEGKVRPPARWAVAARTEQDNSVLDSLPIVPCQVAQQDIGDIYTPAGGYIEMHLACTDWDKPYGPVAPLP